MESRWSLTSRPHPPKQVGLPMQQHPAYGRACKQLGADPFWLEWRSGRQVLGTAQVLRRRWPVFGDFALLSRGPSFDPEVPEDEARAALAELIADLAPTHRGVMATPDRIGGKDPLAGSGMLRMVSAGHIARLSLAPAPEALRAALNPKWRGRLRRAENADLKLGVGPMPPDPGHWLLREEAAQSHTRRYARLPPEFAVAWASRSETLLLTAHQGKTPIAGTLFLIHKPWASYHVAWTSEAGRQLHAHNLLIWRAMLALRERGVTALELGLLDTVKTPGLARFKLCTGAVPVQVGSTWMRSLGSGAVAKLAGLGRAA